MPKVLLNDTDQFFADEGTGNPLLFIPGLGATHAMFAPQREPFRGTHRLLLPDLRGTGLSGSLEGPSETVISRQCDDLAAILDHLNIERVVAVGVSYGGAVALEFGLRHPGRVAGLVAVDTFAELSPRHPTEAFLLAVSYLTLPAYYLPRPALKTVARIAFRRWPAARDLSSRLVDEFRPAEAVLQSVAMCRIGPATRLENLRCPVLGLVGGRFRMAVRLMERALRPIPEARLEVVASSMDPTNLCRPEEFNRRLGAFLAEIAW